MHDNTVLVRPTSDSNVREYHLTGAQEITTVPFAEFYHPLHDSDQKFPELGETGQTLADQLMDGKHDEQIERISIRPFSVRVRKTALATWPKVESEIVIPALKTAFENKQLKVRQYGDVNLRQLAHA